MVGNGTDPAVVLFQTTGSSKTYVPFDGAGTIDFGTSKGVFFYPRKNNVFYTQPVHLRTRLTGKNGVNYLCANGNDSADTTAPNASFSVDAANDYEGDTALDLGGRTLTVRRLTEGESAQIVNGELNELKPRCGLLLLVR